MQLPTSYFCNLDTILCGDLYQALPVLDSTIFDNKPSTIELMPYNFWTNNVKYYSLTTTMCQKDEKFLSILNNIRLGQHTHNDIYHLNQTCLQTPPIDPTFPYLFYKKKDVNAHNNNMLSKVPGNYIILDAVDSEDKNFNAMRLYTQTMILPAQIVVKPNILVRIFSGNYNTKDGLVNGSNEIFKAYTKQQEVDIVWI